MRSTTARVTILDIHLEGPIIFRRYSCSDVMVMHTAGTRRRDGRDTPCTRCWQNCAVHQRSHRLHLVRREQLENLVDGRFLLCCGASHSIASSSKSLS